MAELTEQATELVAEAAEDVAEGALAVAEASRGLSPREVSIALTGAVFGIGIGFAVGWRLCNKRLSVKYEELVQEEIEQMREHFEAKRVVKEEVKPDLAEVVEDLGYATVEEKAEVIAVAPPAPETPRPMKPPVPVREPKPEIRNVFEASIPPVAEWDYAVEMKKRAALDPRDPYVIHQDEYGEEEGYETETVTYFEADDVLGSGRDEVLDQEETVGLPNLALFGHGSGDANIVYVRNPELQIDYEIIKSPGSYAQEVHGFDPPDPSELRHTMRRGRQRFDDE